MKRRELIDFATAVRVSVWGEIKDFSRFINMGKADSGRSISIKDLQPDKKDLEMWGIQHE